MSIAGPIRGKRMARPEKRSQKRAHKTAPVNLETVRQLALALPEVQEEVSDHSPVFRVRGKPIAWLSKDGESLLIKIDYLKRDILLNAEPDTFYVTDFYRCHPMMFVRLSGVSRDVLGDLLEQSWRLQAPKRLIQAFEDHKDL